MRLSAVFLPVALVACGSGGGAAGGPTVEQLTKAQENVHPFQPWGEAEGKLKESLGEPKKVEGDQYIWAAQAGEKCQVLTVQKMGESVGSAAIEEKACP
jgi:hypothetical protein